jgi:hypothetical protein
LGYGSGENSERRSTKHSATKEGSVDGRAHGSLFTVED